MDMGSLRNSGLTRLTYNLECAEPAQVFGERTLSFRMDHISGSPPPSVPHVQLGIGSSGPGSLALRTLSLDLSLIPMN